MPRARTESVCLAVAAMTIAVVAGPGQASAADPFCHAGICDIPWAWDDNELPPRDNPPVPQGFVLTVPIRPGRPSAATRTDAAPLNRYAEVGGVLGRCWEPASEPGLQHWGEVTLRVSFKRDGSVNGVPRVVHVSERDDPKLGADLRRSLLSALLSCAPLHFSASLGNAVAGQIFAIRFVQQGPTT